MRRDNEQRHDGLKIAGADRINILYQIAEERRRQVEDLALSTEEDDGATQGQLARMASGYAFGSTVYADLGQGLKPGSAPDFWPHGRAYYNPEDPRSDLIRAAALIVAEIERLDRAEEKAGAA
jgi:hypothetical protein